MRDAARTGRAPREILLHARPRVMPLRRSAIAILGAAQCVYWGVLYYAYAVMLVPMHAELGASEVVVAGACSAGLATSALAAPLVGRSLDRGRGLVLLRAGALGGAALLWAWSRVEDVAALYAVWIGLGAAMALVLYESAFAILTRAIADPAARLRALASVTVFGGLASTVFVPLAGVCIGQLGWRTTIQVLLVAWLLAAWAIERGVVAAVPRGAEAARSPSVSGPDPQPRIGELFALSTPFVVATFAAMAVTTVLIPSLTAAGRRIETAAAVLGVLGLMQLPGRIALLRGAARVSARGLLVLPLVLQVCGLAVLAASPSVPVSIAGVALFGLGAGLHTVARPWAVAQRFGVASAGRANGAIARAHGIARAVGPFAAMLLYMHGGSSVVFGATALVLLLSCPFALASARRTSPLALAPA